LAPAGAPMLIRSAPPGTPDKVVDRLSFPLLDIERKFLCYINGLKF
jgi:hypothetical protein